MKMALGDRLGGVVFDIQQYRSFKRSGVALPDYGNPVRRKWIEYCSEFLGIIEEMDEKELREPEQASISTNLANLAESPNPRIEPIFDHRAVGAGGGDDKDFCDECKSWNCCSTQGPLVRETKKQMLPNCQHSAQSYEYVCTECHTVRPK